MSEVRPKSEEDWLRLLQMQAEGFWGAARAGELRGPLVRLAGTISRITARPPAKETAPYPRMPRAAREVEGDE
jgi:hypothetical protein